MTQRVNIQYSINLGELPAEVDRIFKVAERQLSEITLSVTDPEDLLGSGPLKTITETRKKLASLDHVLSDLSGIIGSYVEYEAAQIRQQNNPAGQPNAEDPPSVP